MATAAQQQAIDYETARLAEEERQRENERTRIRGECKEVAARLAPQLEALRNMATALEENYKGIGNEVAAARLREAATEAEGLKTRLETV